jgi:hypothetical protein
MELGAGFAFMGKEYRLIVGKTEQFLDMLFYHTRLHCYVVVEVKVTDFDPRDMGQLATYVSAVDGILKSDGDAPCGAYLQSKYAPTPKAGLSPRNASLGLVVLIDISGNNIV